MIDYRCEQCGASFSLPIGMTCDDHRPVPTEPVDDLLQPLLDSFLARSNVECQGCGHPDAECRPQWSEQRKCCPDCSHGTTPENVETPT